MSLSNALFDCEFVTYKDMVEVIQQTHGWTWNALIASHEIIIANYGFKDSQKVL